MNTAGNGVVGSIQDEGHTFVNTLKTPFDQLSGMKR
jgi:DNA-directed RNA polymerase subunit L